MRRALKSWEVGIVLGLGAFMIRLLYIAFWGDDIGIRPGTDAVSYDEFARLMMSGWQWISTPLAAREPLYPAFMALSYVLPGSEMGALKLLQSLLGGAAVCSIFFALRLVIRESVALWGALLVALNPHFIFYSAMPYRENLIIPLLAGFLVLCMLATVKSSRRLMALTAFIYALLVHTDVRFLPLAAAVPFMMYAMNRKMKDSVRQAMWFWLILIFFMVPYQVRGYVAFHKPVIVTERFLDRWLPMVGERYSSSKGEAVFEKRLLWLLDWNTEKQRNYEDLSSLEKRWYDAGIRPQVDKAAVYAFLFKEYWRFCRLRPEYRPYPDGRFTGVWSKRHNLASSLVLIPFFIFFPFIWVDSRPEERRLALFLLVFLLSHMLLHMAVHALERYRIPIEVILAMLLALGWVNVWTWAGGKWRRRAARTA